MRKKAKDPKRLHEPSFAFEQLKVPIYKKSGYLNDCRTTQGDSEMKENKATKVKEEKAEPLDTHQHPLLSSNCGPKPARTDRCHVDEPNLKDYYLLRPDLKTCNDCQVEFKTQPTYTYHMKNFHPDLLKCRLQGCKKFFRKKSDLDCHLIMSHKKSVICAVCANIFSAKKALETHFVNQHLHKKKTPTRVMSNCTCCGKFYKQSCQFCPLGENHRHGSTLKPAPLQGCNKVEPIMQNNFRCVYCEQTFLKKYQFVRHVLKWHRDLAGHKKCSFRGCTHIFKSQSEMEKHYMDNHLLHSKCDICGFLAPTLPAIQLHMKKAHFPTPKWQQKEAACIHCGRFYQNMQVHLRIKHRDKMVKCPQPKCGAGLFASVKALDLHLQEVHVPQKCPYCSKAFEKGYKLVKHVTKQHPNKAGVKCSFWGCVLFFETRSKMEQHYMDNHPLQAKCDLCGFLASSLKILLCHMKRRHVPLFEQGQPRVRAIRRRLLKTVSCNFCMEKLPKSKIWMHTKNKTCYKCSKSFSCEGLLREHSPTCFVQCPLCQKLFKDNHNLRRHKLTHGSNSAGQRYKALGFECEECKRYFSSLHCLNQHFLRMHKRRRVQNKNLLSCGILHEFRMEETFQCQICPNSFGWRNVLKRHYKMAHGGMIECRNCGKVMREFTYQKIHRKICRR